jgi:hypothetical protein
MKNQHRLAYFLIVWVCTLSLATAQTSIRPLLKEGDILFQQLNGGELSKAIDKVTHGYHGHDYNHCALVVRVNDTLCVVEAIGKEVHLSSIKTFEGRCSQSDLLIGRLKPAYRKLIPVAVKVALKFQGIPYDDYFEMNNGKLYCSELIYEAFKSANHGKALFALQPMTFKDPDTKQLFPAWINYYQSLHYPIPQGKPGINPGLLSRSSKLTIIDVR